MSLAQIKLYVDGSVHKASQADSRGKGAYKFVAMSGVLLHEQAFREDDQTVPETEMKALIKGLEWFDVCPYFKGGVLLTILTDSQLVEKWMGGGYRVRADNIMPLYIMAKSLVDKLERRGVIITIEKIRGKENLAHLEA
jgi:ribonuclease HI